MLNNTVPYFITGIRVFWLLRIFFKYCERRTHLYQYTGVLLRIRDSPNANVENALFSRDMNPYRYSFTSKAQISVAFPLCHSVCTIALCKIFCSGYIFQGFSKRGFVCLRLLARVFVVLLDIFFYKQISRFFFS
jgi:hypothetical protein